MKERLPNIHPGEVLLEEFLKPLGMTQNRLAREIHVPPRRINEIVLISASATAALPVCR
jgi:addiction module HigA family antidote